MRRSSQNAISHGLLSRETLLDGEDPEVFAAVWDQLFRELQPEGELETYLAGRIIGSIWRMNRVVRSEAGLFNRPEFSFSGGPRNIGEIFRLERHEGSNAFSNLFRYETTVDLSFHRALHSLRLVQEARKKLGSDPIADGREIRRITKRTQSCAKRAGKRVCRRNFMDWLYQPPAKLEQERVSRVTGNLPDPAILPGAGRSRNSAAA